MHFSRDIPHVKHYIKSYHPGKVSIGDALFTSSLIIYQDKVTPEWEPAHITHLSREHLMLLRDYKPEVILLGTGEKQHFPAADVIDPVLRAGIGLEIMSTESACRTFNLLASEGRDVLLAIIV